LQRRQEFRITKPITTGERSASACRESVKREGGLKTELGSNDSFNGTIGFLQRLSLVVFFGDFLAPARKSPKNRHGEALEPAAIQTFMFCYCLPRRRAALPMTPPGTLRVVVTALWSFLSRATGATNWILSSGYASAVVGNGHGRSVCRNCRFCPKLCKIETSSYRTNLSSSTNPNLSMREKTHPVNEPGAFLKYLISSSEPRGSSRRCPRQSACTLPKPLRQYRCGRTRRSRRGGPAESGNSRSGTRKPRRPSRR